jgi:hypothetical protein
MDGDLTFDLKRMSEDRHQIFKKLESIKKRMDALQIQMNADKNISIDVIENELLSLEDEGYRLEIQLSSIVTHLKSIRDSDRAPEAI